MAIKKNKVNDETNKEKDSKKTLNTKKVEKVKKIIVKKKEDNKVKNNDVMAKRKAFLEKIKNAKTLKKEPKEIEEKKDVEIVKTEEKKEAKKEDTSSYETFKIQNGVPINNNRSIPKTHKKEIKEEIIIKEENKLEKENKKEEKIIETKKEEIKKDEVVETKEEEKEIIVSNLKKISVSVQFTVRELAEKMGIKGGDLIKKLMTMGVFATITQRLEPDIATLIAMEYGYDLEIVPLYLGEAIEQETEKEDPSNLVSRPPVITIMGHVDHGKTTLLDALRESNVVDNEAGQITQHIGAYTIKTDKGYITVLDTPGHEAFTAMRAHGVKVTDIVIIVVSATDGVMPQTIEAINHAKAANVPIIVAINKIDLPTANVQNVKTELSNNGLIAEDWGGNVPMIEISAKKRINLDKLLEIVHIQSEIMELKANPKGLGVGIVVEAKKDSKKGVLATIICTKGTIKIGDPFIVGTAYGKVRALIDDKGKRLDKITPSFPAELLGIGQDVPMAGDKIRVLESEKEARHISETRKIHKKQEDLIHQKVVSLSSLKSQVDQKKLKMLNIVLKTDVYGSMQAIKDSLEKLSNTEVAIHVLHSGIGNITESDIMLAKASSAIIFGFNVSAEDKIMEEAQKNGIEIRIYKIIYDLLEELKLAMSGMLEPEIVETLIGKAIIKQVFDLTSNGKVAGSLIQEGKITRGAIARIYRSNEEIGHGKISGLKRFKEDVKEVEKGFECGISLEGFKNFEPNDEIRAFIKEEKLRRLNV